jgi:hypothetical protein
MHEPLACLIHDMFTTQIGIRIKTSQVLPADSIGGPSCGVMVWFKCSDNLIAFTRSLRALIVDHPSELSPVVESLTLEVSDRLANNRTSGISDRYGTVSERLRFEASESDLPIGLELSATVRLRKRRGEIR